MMAAGVAYRFGVCYAFPFITEGDMLGQSTPRTKMHAFALGKICATHGAMDAMERANTPPRKLMERHLLGGWGDAGTEESSAKKRALLEGARLLSAHTLPLTGAHIWVITDCYRSTTTILLPEEY